MFRGLARLFVATAAGAGMGAAAALARRHMLGQGAAFDGASLWAPEVTEPVAGAEPPAAAAAPSASVAPAAAVSPPAPVAPPASADVADLDSARARLRERAAALRAEMEG